MSKVKIISYSVVAILIIIQFFRIDKTNPVVDSSSDMLTVIDTSPEVVQILKTSCYDCHTNETIYPWYTNVAPVSWWVKDHINEGRDELNFSDWGTYSIRRKDHKLDEVVEMLEEDEMPLTSYLIAHRDASLSDAQKTLLIDWAKKSREDLGYVPEKKD